MDDLVRAIALASRVSAALSNLGIAPPDEKAAQDALHPFDRMNLHTSLPLKVRALFDDGHFPEATFAASVYLDNLVKRLSNLKGKTGYKLMMDAFNEEAPKVRVNGLESESERDEQVGIKFLFAGVASALRNPRGHEHDLIETPDQCLDHLALISFLLRKLEAAGYQV